MNYLKLLNETIDLYLQGNFQKAYDLVTKYQDEILGVDAQLYNFRYAIAAKMGKKALALRLLHEAIIEKEYWYSQDILLEDDDLKTLQEDKTFQKIVEQSRKQEQKAKQSSTFLYEKTNDQVDELLLVLHGNQLNNVMAKSEWYDKTLDISFGFLQSNTIEFSNGYSWEDFKAGVKKISEIYTDEMKHKEKIYCGGFSAGAGVVFDSVIKTEITPQGIFLLAPWLPTIEEDIELIKKLKEKNIKIFILIGDEDNDCLETTNQLINILKDQEIQYKFKLIKGLKHEYPSDFQKYLKEAFDYFKK